MRRSEPGSPHPLTTESPAAEATGARPGLTEEQPAPRIASPAGSRPEPSPASDRADGGPRPVPVTVWRRVGVDATTAFDVVVPIDLPSIFRGYGPLPAVTGAEGNAGLWGVEGQRRTVRLADGGRLDESVVQVSRPGLFRYEVVPTRGLLRVFIRAIDGRFIFAPSEAGGTVIRWTYVFRPRRGARPFVQAIAPLWRRYALRVMERLADAVAAHPAPTESR